MRHYDLREVMERIHRCVFFGGASGATYDWFAALIAQANSAWDLQRENERLIGQHLGTAVDERQAEIAEALEVEK